MTTNSFWDFSVQLYAKPGVEQACLALQDQFGLDVNNVLFCLWHGQLYGEFPHSTLSRMITFTNEWQTNLVEPLRSARSWMKGKERLIEDSMQSCENLRNSIKKLELQAEHLQQNQLQSLVSGVPEYESNDPRQAMIENFQRYITTVEMKPKQKLMAHFEIILSALDGKNG